MPPEDPAYQAPTAIDPARLRVGPQPGDFDFDSTAELRPLAQIPGQLRALEAIRFGIGIRRQGYNLFVLGPAGLGKRTTVREYVDQLAADQPVPDDWCHVHDFAQPNRPRALRLPAGRGRRLREDLRQLLDELMVAIPAALESREYRERRVGIDQALEQAQAEAFQTLESDAQAAGVRLVQTPNKFSFVPMRDAETLDAEDFSQLPEAEQREIERRISELQSRLRELLQNHIPRWRRRQRERIRQLNDEFALYAVGHLIDGLRQDWADLDPVLEHLQAVQADVVTHAEDFLQPPGADGAQRARIEARLQRYQVNLLVDHGDSTGAPVIWEDHPGYGNLIGRVEYRAHMGAWSTDFTLIRPGALHRANGGYLLLDARHLLGQPLVWAALKRALYAGQLRIEAPAGDLAPFSSVGLEPQPIALDVKLILLGERELYYLLQEYDADFTELFKVAADFEDELPWSPQQAPELAQLVATLVAREGLRPFDAGAVAAVLRQAMRRAADSRQLSAHMRSLADLLIEADYLAGQSEWVSVAEVQRASELQRRRRERVPEQLQMQIERGTLWIESSGSRVGQINGLSVLELGDCSFGLPSRITATCRLGEGEFVDIQREIELAGPLHSKGVYTLAAFLAAHYAPNHPLSLSASLSFEQSYGLVEGDSASLAELCALISAIAERPLRQDLAVTGAIDQHGRVQAIGGVNEKVEAWFDLCAARGLSGTQGVVLPAANVENLVLRDEVIAAAEAGRFHLYAVERVDSALELLLEGPAGEADAQGLFPEHSLHGAVQQRLLTLASLRQLFAAGARASGDEEPPPNPGPAANDDQSDP